MKDSDAREPPTYLQQRLNDDALVVDIRERGRPMVYLCPCLTCWWRRTMTLLSAPYDRED